ncbi:MAG: PLP-dependent aminotransferase family protein [Clostridiales bacterium]|nr:PLP-dependent aminotransferase family protein [Clostridiales bacterium]
MNSFTLEFDRGSRVPIYEQLYAYIANGVRSGLLKENERLPSKKALASHLGISSNTVDAAYSMLCQEGYVYSRPRSGYYVSRLELALPAPETAVSEPEQTSRSYRYDFMTNTVDAGSFPFRTWAKLGKEVLYNGEALLSAGNCRGDIELLSALSKYLREFRAVDCSPSQIVIGAGMEYLLMLLCRLLPREAEFAVEEPGYVKTPAILEGCGRRLHYIALDGDGMDAAALSDCGASVACITPSHQFPTGIVMPIGRRAELLKWASAAPGRYIIEDDYNSEFNFVGRPIPSLQGMDSRRVIYISTFSRILAPSIRIAYMVLPPEFLRSAGDILSSYSSTVSRFDQHTLANFIDGGYLSRHLNRMKTLYRRRRDILTEALAPHAARLGLSLSGGAAGLHLLLSGDGSTIGRILTRAEKENIRVPRMSDSYHSYDGEGDTLIFGYAGMKNEDIPKAISLLFDGI